MTPQNFVYWLNGFIELANPETLTKEQIEEIKNHLRLVMTKVTPDIMPPPYVPAMPLPNPYVPAMPLPNPFDRIRPARHPWDFDKLEITCSQKDRPSTYC